MSHSEQPVQGTPASSTQPADQLTQQHKKVLRTSIRAARALRSAADHAAFATRLAEWEPPAGARRVSCFIGMTGEPDTGPLIDRLTERGIEVLLPITLPDFSLDWAVYTGPDALVDARFGLKEPTGQRLGAEAIGTADVVLIPALAVDAEGRRLGQGAGCYDRALPHVSSTTPVLAVVFDDERLSEPLPEEPHDRRVDGVVP